MKSNHVFQIYTTRSLTGLDTSEGEAAHAHIFTATVVPVSVLVGYQVDTRDTVDVMCFVVLFVFSLFFFCCVWT